MFHVAPTVRAQRTSAPIPATLGLALAAPILLSAVACSGGSSSHGAALGASGSVGAPVTTYVTFVRPHGIASIVRGDGAFESAFQVINEAEGGMAFDYLGNLYQADLQGDEGGAIQIMTGASRRSYGNQQGSLNPSFDRAIVGFSTTLDEPRSVALAHGPGLVLVTDSGAAEVKVFGASAGGDVPPTFTVPTAAAPWDLAYDEPSDRLYVTLMDGTIEVFDDFLAAQPPTSSRTIVPSLDGVEASGSDLRGIALLPHDTGMGLVVSDVGELENGIDGAIFVFDDVSAAAGLTIPSQTLRGAGPGLRDPLDLALSPDGYLRVVDSDASQALVFPARSTRRFEGAPSVTRPFLNARAIVIEPTDPERDILPASDLDSEDAAIGEIVAITAPRGTAGAIMRLSADLQTAPHASFDPGLDPRGLGLDYFGNVYTTFSQPGGSGAYEGGVRVFNRLGLERGTGTEMAYDPSRDRALEIKGSPFFPVPKPVAPSGLDVDECTQTIVFSDPERPGIWSFGMNAGPESEELDVIDQGLALGTAEPAQLDYDAASDTLYVAISNGTVYVYEHFRAVPGDAPDRTITPTDSVGASQVSTNLKGLVHDAERDVLIVSDVGAGSGTGNDGAIYVFEAASAATGLYAPLLTIEGPATGLDQPVGLAWNGSSLWVADQANGTISRFDDLLTLDGNVAPAASIAVPDVISVALRAEGLSPTTGGSIF